MAKKGALKSTLIVTSDELKVNGGRWLLQSGPAIRVRGFNSSSIGDRKVIGGDALPIYILAETDARVNGGQFLLKGGQPIQVTDVIGSARGVIQGKAIPVWPVDDDGNYDADFAGFLPTSIANLEFWVAGDLGLSLSDADPVALWPDQSGNGNDLTQGVGVKQPTYKISIVNGKPIVRFDGIDDFLAVGFALVQPEHVFYVFNLVVDAAGVYMSDGSGVNLMGFLRDGAGPTVGLFAGAVGVGLRPINIGTFHIASCLFNGASSEIRIDGGNDDTGNVGANDGAGISLGMLGNGTTNAAQVDFAEVIVYSSALSDGNRGLVEIYLANKYGISI